MIHSLAHDCHYPNRHCIDRQHGGKETGDAKKLKQLEDENQKLKHVVAELTLDNRALKDVLFKKLLAPVGLRAIGKDGCSQPGLQGRGPADTPRGNTPCRWPLRVQGIAS